MEPAKLISSTTELALDLLEKRGEVVPFCKAVAEDGSLFIYTPETNDPEDGLFADFNGSQREAAFEGLMVR
jgi:hypothetical protein